MASSAVEGEWNGFIFKIIQGEDIPKVYEHLKAEFLHNERTSQLAGFSEEYAQDFILIYDWIFSVNDGLCLMAEDSENGNIAGVFITYKVTKDTNFSKFNFQSKAMKKIMTFIDAVENGVNLFENYRIDHYADLLKVSTAQAYRNRGLATEMCRRLIDLLRSKNIPLVSSIFTSPFTRKMGINFGFKQVFSLYYKELKDAEGEIMFPEANEEDHGLFMCLQI